MGRFKLTATSYPSPLQTGVDGKTVLTLSALDTDAECREIEFSFIKGDTEGALFSDDGTHKPTVRLEKGWIPTVKVKRLKEAENVYRCMAVNDTGSLTLTKPVSFTIEGLVNNTAGTATVLAVVNDNEEEYFELKVEKAVAPFYLRNFITRADVASVPMTEFYAGRDIYFSWESNGTNFKLYSGRDLIPISCENTNYMLKGGVKNDTAFILAAEYNDGIETRVLYDKICVIIANEITGFFVNSGEIIDGVTFLHRNGTRTVLGGTGGNLSPTIQLLKGEHIVSIIYERVIDGSSFYKDCVCMLNFKTNKGNNFSYKCGFYDKFTTKKLISLTAPQGRYIYAIGGTHHSHNEYLASLSIEETREL